MSEKGSDEMLAELADFGSVDAGVRAELERVSAEEQRVAAVPVDDDPGRDHPDPDEGPPPHQEHPEFDPVPPAG